MAYFKKNDALTKKICLHTYSGINEKDLGKKVNEVLLISKYKLRKGIPEDGIYVRGSLFTRILVGSFHKHFKFSVKINSCNSGVQLALNKERSGSSGGLIGIAQTKKELKRLSAILQTI